MRRIMVAMKCAAAATDFARSLMGLLASDAKRAADALKVTPDALLRATFSSMGAVADFFATYFEAVAVSEELWLSHFALTSFARDAVASLERSLHTAFAAHYSTAYAALRVALESCTRGAIYELLALPSYRAKANHLLGIGGLRKRGGQGEAPSYGELIEELEREARGSRLPSARVIAAAEKLNLNPRPAFNGLLNQLEDWGVIEDRIRGVVEELYEVASGFAHRPLLRYTDSGQRMKGGDWLALLVFEHEPEALAEFLLYFVETCGVMLYLALRTVAASEPQLLTKSPADYVKRFVERVGDAREAVDELLTEGVAELREIWRKVEETAEKLCGVSHSRERREPLSVSVEFLEEVRERVARNADLLRALLETVSEQAEGVRSVLGDLVEKDLLGTIELGSEAADAMLLTETLLGDKGKALWEARGELRRLYESAFLMLDHALFSALSGYYEAGWAEASIALAYAARGLASARGKEAGTAEAVADAFSKLIERGVLSKGEAAEALALYKRLSESASAPPEEGLEAVASCVRDIVEACGLVAYAACHLLAEDRERLELLRQLMLQGESARCLARLEWSAWWRRVRALLAAQQP